jgi:ABC-type glycerol-3-phosphate transport system permease component
MVVIALRPETAIDFPSSLLPWNLDTSAFREVLAGQDMLRWTLNSVVYSVVSVVAVLVMASMAGYAFAKKRFPGREAMFWSFLAMVMVPYHVTLIPTFIVMAKLGGVDTYWGLILPSLANAQAVFLMRQFIKGLPDELFEAAKIDGAGEWRTFATIVLPLCKPVLATLGTFVFLWHWNDFLWPLIIGKSADMWTLTVGIASLRQQQVPLSVVLADMEAAGIAVDMDALTALIDEFASNAAQAKKEAYEAIGHEVNLGSPKQLQVVLFEELELPKTKKIKTGYTTDAASLQDLLEKTGHPFLVALMAHRDATKLGQMAEGLRKAVASDGRIHTTYGQTVAATGRLSSLNPNLQNIPVRSEAGRRLREVFVVGEGYETLLTADYSQIEMRILVHLSGDEALVQAFKDGEDLHRFVGSHVFGVAPEDVTPEMRSKVKAMSYGLAYGLSSFGLSKQLNISVDEARTLMKDYYSRFGAVKTYLQDVVKQAKKDLYTQTLLGRRRNLPDLNSDVRQLRDIAERAALNAPIQGTAADIIKLAMLAVAKRIEAEGLESRMLLQVHDELLVEVAPGEADAVRTILVEEMGSAMELKVPLDVHVGVGRTWQEAGH